MSIERSESSDLALARRFSVAPMMAWTDRHDRFLLRLISPSVLLYTEMVTTGALIYGDRERYLRYNDCEHPLALQLGGNDPVHMAQCAAYGEAAGYDEINMNVGCPSDRVQSGCFGAALMAEPGTVAACVKAMTAAVDVPVTVKTRIGIDDRDQYHHLIDFIKPVRDAGCDIFIIHARKAWLSGLSPKQNRDIPPLHYDVVARLRDDFPECTFILNGGIQDIAQAMCHLEQFAGVMLGRAVYQNPYILAEVEEKIFAKSCPRSRDDVLDAYCEYAERAIAEGVPLRPIARHAIGLFHGMPGARRWRRLLSEQLPLRNDAELLRDARAAMRSRAPLALAG